MHQIFSRADTDSIERDAASSPYFRFENKIINISAVQDKEIVSISKKRLILVKGNLSTGFDHIKSRHDFWSIFQYPLGEKFQIQSKFPSKIPPYFYTDIADQVFDPGNLVLDNNHQDSDLFSKYQGAAILINEKIEKVNLILYKNSKIIHSLYPQKNTYNRDRRKENFHFRKGKVEIEDSVDGCKIIKIPYFDHNIDLRFVIIVEKNYFDNIEKWLLLVYKNNEYIYHIDFGSQTLLKFNEGGTIEIGFYQHTDFDEIEKFMTKVNNGEIKYDPDFS